MASGLVLAGVAGAGVYAWWATALPAFTTRSYLGVAIPVVIVLGVAVMVRAPAVSRNVTSARVSRAIWPWLVLVGAGVALETVGLALGGRSRTVPTLSDVVDRLIAPHACRALTFVVWLAVGLAALFVMSRHGADRP